MAEFRSRFDQGADLRAQLRPLAEHFRVSTQVVLGRIREAGASISGKSENGWWFLLLSPTTRKSLSDLWHEYVDQTAVDVDEADMPEEDDE